MRFALLTIGVALCALLACTDRAGTAPVAGGGGIATFEGAWRNEDEKTAGITRIEIRPRGDGVDVKMWGKCQPADCDFGTPESYDLASRAKGELSLVWKHGFAVRNQDLKLFPEGRMEVVTRTRFTDNSGRRDYESRDFFRKAAKP